MKMNDEDIKTEKEKEMIREIEQERREREFDEWVDMNKESLKEDFINDCYPDEFAEFCWDEYIRSI
jgi:hypothetical protein